MRWLEMLKAALVLVISSGVAMVCLQGILYLSAQLATVDAHAARITSLEAHLIKSNEATAAAFQAIEADRRVYRERFLEDLAEIKAKLGILPRRH